jgi:general secretion pathway protein G
MNRINRTGQAGFTLIEIMLVVVIMGILMTVAVVKLGGKTRDAQITAARADIKAYSTALSLFELDNGFYPTTEQGLAALVVKPATPPEPLRWKTYLETPVRPDPWGSHYLYKCPGDRKPDGYDLSSAGPNGIPGDGDDVTNWD